MRASRVFLRSFCAFYRLGVLHRLRTAIALSKTDDENHALS